jgi:hypothetical protein
MPCPANIEELPNHLNKILKQIEVGNNTELKSCSCSLRGAQQRCDSPYGGYTTAFPFCIPTKQEIIETYIDPDPGMEICDEHDIDLKDLSEVFYAKKVWFQGVYGQAGELIGCPENCTPQSTKLESQRDNLLEGIDIKQSVCNKRYSTTAGLFNSFMYFPPVVNINLMGQNTTSRLVFTPCPGCEEDCFPQYGKGLLQLDGIFSVYKYDEGTGENKNKWKYKGFSLRVGDGTQCQEIDWCCTTWDGGQALGYKIPIHNTIYGRQIFGPTCKAGIVSIEVND